ncbi:branched-chain amino acid ABC transporter permease [Bartonella sp. F02]|uniref:branched-chain amino acid ABC transporter permease n=1 Tax=Bartonella sp. F02 TaxID=2967262 RepID=UPI0022A9C1F6|nr:branched-chain amino acid ABC transporter permease [Bartonella sp. F02]MCZ2328281.1 branched-chain amino acid ABC transporter permease [Bartonella sp. F02]
MAKSTTTFLSLISIILFIGFLFYADSHFNDYTLRIINLVAINAILAISLNLIYGFTGMFSLGHAGFMAIGAYVCAILLLSPEQKEMMWILEPIIDPLQNLQLSFFPAVVISGLCAAIVGLLIALPILRLGGDYLGIATLGFAEIIRVVITNATSLTNGALGIKGIPQDATLWWNYGWLAFTVIFITLLLRSNTGNVLRAIRDDEIAAKTMGVNAFFYRSFSFTVGAFFAGVGGALMAALISTIDPKMFNFLLTFNILMIVVAGGLGSITGSIIGSIIITVMLEWFRIIESPLDLGFIYIPGIPGLRMVIFSLLLLVIILFWRKGLLGQREFSWNGIYCFLTRKKISNCEEKS